MYYMQKQAAQNRVINQFARFIKSAGKDKYVMTESGYKVDRNAFPNPLDAKYETLENGERVDRDAITDDYIFRKKTEQLYPGTHSVVISGPADEDASDDYNIEIVPEKGSRRESIPERSGSLSSLLSDIKYNPIQAGVGLSAGALTSFLAYRAARKRKASKLVAALAALGAGGAATAGSYLALPRQRSIVVNKD